MRQILIFLMLGIVLFSCKKDKVPKICEGMDMSERRSKMIGTWRWYKTLVNQTFASGNTYTFDYTPSTEGYNYYFTISADGMYKGYKDSILVHQHLLTGVVNEDVVNPFSFYLTSKLDCSSEIIRIAFSSPSSSFDTISQFEYPIRFDDEVANKHSKLNFFVKV